MQYVRQPSCSVISLFYYIPLAECGQIRASNKSLHCHPSSVLTTQKNAKGAPPSIFSVGPEVSWNNPRSFIYHERFPNPAKSSPANAVQRLSPAVPALAVVLPDKAD